MVPRLLSQDLYTILFARIQEIRRATLLSTLITPEFKFYPSRVAYVSGDGSFQTILEPGITEKNLSRLGNQAPWCQTNLGDLRCADVCWVDLWPPAEPCDRPRTHVGDFFGNWRRWWGGERPVRPLGLSALPLPKHFTSKTRSWTLIYPCLSSDWVCYRI